MIAGGAEWHVRSLFQDCTVEESRVRTRPKDEASADRQGAEGRQCIDLSQVVPDMEAMKMSDFTNKLVAFVREEEGLELSEYALMAALVIIVAVATILAVGTRINEVFSLLLSALGG